MELSNCATALICFPLRSSFFLFSDMEYKTQARTLLATFSPLFRICRCFFAVSSFPLFLSPSMIQERVRGGNFPPSLGMLSFAATFETYGSPPFVFFVPRLYFLSPNFARRPDDSGRVLGFCVLPFNCRRLYLVFPAEGFEVFNRRAVFIPSGRSFFPSSRIPLQKRKNGSGLPQHLFQLFQSASFPPRPPPTQAPLHFLSVPVLISPLEPRTSPPSHFHFFNLPSASRRFFF